MSVEASLGSNPTAPCPQCPVHLREIASLKQAYQNLQSESDARHSSLQTSRAAITDSLEQFKRQRLGETEELKPRLFDLGQTNSQLSAQGTQEAHRLRDLNAQLTQQIHESERRYRESVAENT